MQRLPGIGSPLADIVGNGAGIGHDLYRVFEDVLVDLLENIGIVRVGSDKICMIDMPVAKGNAADGIAGNAERIGGFLDRHGFTSKNNGALPGKRQKRFL